MFRYKSFTLNPIQENTYLVWDEETRECAVIDCGAFSNVDNMVLSCFIGENKLTPVLALQTHCHFDHIFGLQWLYDRYGAIPMCHKLEKAIYDMQDELLSESFNIDFELELPPIEDFFEDGDEIELGRGKIKVIHTPGHTPGGVCFYIEEDKTLISGDTLFCHGMGRTDLPGGNWEQEMLSIRNRLLTLPGDTKVLCGHGPSTTIEDERRG